MMEHSYTSAPQIEYGSSSFSRITVLTPEAKFVNPVHELLKGVVYRNEYNIKETFVHHVGYIGKLSDKKIDRNRKIMDAELEKHPDNLHLWLQQIAGVGSDADETLDLSEKQFLNLENLNYQIGTIKIGLKSFFIE